MSNILESHILCAILCTATFVVVVMRFFFTMSEHRRIAVTELIRMFTVTMCAVSFVVGNAEGRLWLMIVSASVIVLILVNKTAETISTPTE